MKKIVLVGGGGHCLSCIDVIEQKGEYEIVGILDKSIEQGKFIGNYPIIGTDDDIPEFHKKGYSFLITVGQIKSSEIRELIYNKIIKVGGELPTIISHRAYVSRSAKLNPGTIIMHDVIVNSNAVIGLCNIINTKANIEHEVKTGDFCHVSTGVILNGQVQIGDRNFIGSNTVIANNVTISDDIVISLGSIIHKKIKTAGVYSNNRKIK